MFRYKGTRRLIKVGDRVKISERWCKENHCLSPFGTVVGLQGFITVATVRGKVDFDARSITPADATI